MTAMERATSEIIFANGLSHAVLRWGAALPSASDGARDGRVVLLLHGFMDAAGTFSAVAPRLAAAGHVVYAPDFRGFGAGARLPSGAYYHFADYVFDLAEIVAHVTQGAKERVTVVGHSMGGTVATLYTGSFPERVAKLVNMEGLGPPELAASTAPLRMRRWVEEVQKVRATEASGAHGRPMSEDDALSRLAMNHGRIPKDILRAQLPHLTRKREDGSLAWAFDPLHRTPSPTPFSAQVFRAFARAVTCPVLFVSGGPHGFHPPDEDERLSEFSELTQKELPDAGHMMHWTEPTALAELLLGFI
jgi:pimeloyl-ACP methyl ester carboxylesterase